MKPDPNIIRYERALSRARIALAAGITALLIVLVPWRWLLVGLVICGVLTMCILHGRGDDD